MALEDLLKDLTAEIAKLNTSTAQLVSLRTEAIESVKAAAGAAPKATKAAAEKAAAAPVEKPADPPAAESVASTAVYDQLSARVAAYVSAATREEERVARKGKIRALFQHDKIKKPGTPPDVYDTFNVMDEALGLFGQQIELLIAAGDLTQPAATTSLV